MSAHPPSCHWKRCPGTVPMDGRNTSLRTKRPRIAFPRNQSLGLVLYLCFPAYCPFLGELCCSERPSKCLNLPSKSEWLLSLFDQSDVAATQARCHLKNSKRPGSGQWRRARLLPYTPDGWEQKCGHESTESAVEQTDWEARGACSPQTESA